MRKLAYFSGFVVLILAVVFGLWTISNSRNFQFFGEIVPRVETSERVVALTFDDGPSPEFTDEILRILEEEDVKATFFLIGGDLEKHLDEGKKIVSAGHEIGNHTFSHRRMVLVTPAFVKEEIEKTDELIRAAGYDKPVYFRPPYGKKLFALPYYLSQNNRKSITWDIEPETFRDVAKSSDEITKYTFANTRNGSIILLHVMYDRERKSMNAVRPIIDGLREKGFRFVTVSELIDMR
ncbi:MAG TPA: polysaccharide deacetylase family protein [Pyrinomonadaceae bacterium]|jgi:chitin deacetylase|nr:polysaccharide deacetylase family protein [Pyrinomonadaceae bacterium]